MNNTVGDTTINDLPQELLDVIIDLVPQNADFKNCALVGKRWVRRCQERLFELITISSREMELWTRPVPENQPLLFSYVRTLTLRRVYPLQWRDANFERHMSCFRGGRSSDSSDRDDDQRPCLVHTLKLEDCSVDFDGEVISRVLGPLRSSVQTLIMGTVSIPPVMDVRPFFFMFSELRNVHIIGQLFSASVPNGESRFANEFTLPPMDGELQLLFLHHGVEGLLSPLSKLPMQFRSITVSPPSERCVLQINNILAVCGGTVKTFHVKRKESEMQVLRPLVLSPCTELEEIRIGLRGSKNPGTGIIPILDSVTSPHLSRVVFRFASLLFSRKIDSSLSPTDWIEVDESLYRLAERLRLTHESRSFAVDATPNWTVPRQKNEAKRLRVLIEARFLFVPTMEIDLGSFLSGFRKVGDVVFIPQKIRTWNEDNHR